MSPSPQKNTGTEFGQAMLNYCKAILNQPSNNPPPIISKAAPDFLADTQTAKKNARYLKDILPVMSRNISLFITFTNERSSYTNYLKKLSALKDNSLISAGFDRLETDLNTFSGNTENTLSIVENAKIMIVTDIQKYKIILCEWSEYIEQLTNTIRALQVIGLNNESLQQDMAILQQYGTTFKALVTKGEAVVEALNEILTSYDMLRSDQNSLIDDIIQAKNSPVNIIRELFIDEVEKKWGQAGEKATALLAV